MCMGFAGCSSSGTSDTSKSISKSSNNAAKEKISIQDIPWNVDEGIVDGTRFVLFDYTNNSKYPITELKISFKEKSGLTADEKTSSTHSSNRKPMQATKIWRNTRKFPFRCTRT